MLERWRLRHPFPGARQYRRAGVPLRCRGHEHYYRRSVPHRAGQQAKEAEAKENDHSRCRDKAERDEGEQGCDIGLRCPGPLSRGIGERNRRFGRLWTRVSTRTSRPELSRQLVEQPLSEHSAAFPLTHPRIQAATGDRKAPALVMNHELPISVLAGGHPARPFAAIEPTYGKSTIRV